MALEDFKARLQAVGERERQLHGIAYQVVCDFDQLQDYFQQDTANPVFVEIPWSEKIAAQTYTYNRVIVKRLTAQDVIFLNPLPGSSQGEPGPRGGPFQGPQRELLADGCERMDTSLFVQLFRFGGGALLPLKS